MSDSKELMDERLLLSLEIRWKYLKNEYILTGDDEIRQQCEKVRRQIIDELNKPKGKQP